MRLTSPVSVIMRRAQGKMTMSLNHAILGLLSERPMSGFDILTEFDAEATGVIWPAPQNEVYRVLARLQSDEFIAVKETGPRGRKTYAITKSGRSELARWIAEPTDYTLRYDPILKAAFLAEMPQKARIARLQSDLAFYSQQLVTLRRLERERKDLPGADHRRDVRRMAIALYAGLAEWCSRGLKESKEG